MKLALDNPGHQRDYEAVSQPSIDPLQSLPLCVAKAGVKTTTLIERSVSHPGAGSFTLDGCFTHEFMSALAYAFDRQPPAHCALPPPGPGLDGSISKGKDLCAERRFFFAEKEGWVNRTLTHAVSMALTSRHGDESATAAAAAVKVMFFPHMRFLLYNDVGGHVPPHTDLRRTCETTGVVSTHTFILYFDQGRPGQQDEYGRGEEMQSKGGETTLLSVLPQACKSGEWVQELVNVEPRVIYIYIYIYIYISPPPSSPSFKSLLSLLCC